MSNLFSSIGNFLTGGGSQTAQTGAALADPFASQRPQYQQQLSQLMSNPSSVTNTPGYQFNFNQGETALQRQEAATGNLNSGTADINAVQYGQNYATNTFNTYEQMLAQLAGGNLSQGNAGSVYAGAMQGPNQATSGLLGSFGSLIGNLTSGIGGSIGGLTSSIGSLFSGGGAGAGASIASAAPGFA